MTDNNPFSDPNFGADVSTPSAALEQRGNPFSDPTFGSNLLPKPKTGEPPVSAAGANPNGILANAPDDTYKSSILKSTGSGALEGVAAVTGLPGMMQDVVNAGMDRLYSLTSGLPLDQAQAKTAVIRAKRQSEAFTPQLPDPQSVLGVATPTTGLYQPKTEVGRLYQSGVAGATGGLLTGGAGAILPNVVGSVTAQGASDLGANPLISTAAGLVGGVGSDMALSSRTAQLMTKAGRQKMAGQAIIDSSSDPTALVADAKTANPATDQLVPGSQPTLFQSQPKGDEGLGQLERQVQTANPAPFVARAKAQSAAQADAVNSLPSGFSQDFADHLTNQLKTLSDAGDAQVADAMQKAKSSADFAPGNSPEQNGQILGPIIRDARAADIANESSLWKAIDPNNDLVVGMSPVKKAQESVYGDMPKATAATLTPAENKLNDLAQQYSTVEPFSELQAYKTALSDAMREARVNGPPAAYGRMKQVMGGVWDAINNTVSQRIAQDESSVAAGTMSPEDTAVANLRKQWGINGQSSGSGAAGVSIPRTAVATSIGGGDGGITGAGPVAEAGGIGTGSQARVPLPENAGAPGVSSSAPSAGVTPPAAPESFPPSSSTVTSPDQAAIDRIRAANEATKARVATHDKSGMGPINAPGPAAGTYKLSDSLIPGKVFAKGPIGGETIRAFRTATKGTPESENALENSAADSFHASVVKDGVVDPKAHENWQKNYGPALAEMRPDFQRQIGSAKVASQMLADTALARKTALDAYQKGAVGKIIAANGDATTIQRHVGSVFGARDAVLQMARLAKEAAKDQTGAAAQGLRKAILDHINTNYLKDIYSGNEAQAVPKAAAFQAFVRQNAPVLEQAFPKENINLFRAISQDIARNNQSVTNKIPGPGTSQDILPYLKAMSQGAPKESLLRQLTEGAIIAKEVGEPLMEHFGDYGGLAVPAIGAGMVGKKMIAAWRDAGMKKVADLVQQGLLDAPTGRTLIMAASKSADQGSQLSLATQLRRASMFNAITTDQRRKSSHK